MKTRKTLNVNKIINTNDDAERQRRCRENGGKSGKVQKPLYLTAKQSEQLLKLKRIGNQGNQQDTINDAIRICYLIYAGNLVKYPIWFSHKMKFIKWIKSVPFRKVSIVIDYDEGARTRKTFDMTQEQQRYLSQLMNVSNRTNQQLTIIHAIYIASEYYSGKLVLPVSFTFWQRLKVWLRLFPFY